MNLPFLSLPFPPSLPSSLPSLHFAQGPNPEHEPSCRHGRRAPLRCSGTLKGVWVGKKERWLRCSDQNVSAIKVFTSSPSPKSKYSGFGNRELEFLFQAHHKPIAHQKPILVKKFTQRQHFSIGAILKESSSAKFSLSSLRWSFSSLSSSPSSLVPSSPLNYIYFSRKGEGRRPNIRWEKGKGEGPRPNIRGYDEVLKKKKEEEERRKKEERICTHPRMVFQGCG